ncbi:hypothetical protein HK102_007156 [Quaeritorhiza haematococci]|nr:hypothetical protein HK102_007156 [Quaeritorhiza haematococci]
MNTLGRVRGDARLIDTVARHCQSLEYVCMYLGVHSWKADAVCLEVDLLNLVRRNGRNLRYFDLDLVFSGADRNIDMFLPSLDWVQTCIQTIAEFCPDLRGLSLDLDGPIAFQPVDPRIVVDVATCISKKCKHLRYLHLPPQLNWRVLLDQGLEELAAKIEAREAVYSKDPVMPDYFDWEFYQSGRTGKMCYL